ncbi:MAG TPA: ComEC/Rec2 family competence protein [Pyrinomonadaceae bacterium]|nr:ComEC/Rec2 family competence protein [Pyrinomonadaceae bacterium]
MSDAPDSAPFNPFPLVGLAAAFAAGVLLARLSSAPLATCAAAAAVLTVAAAVSTFKHRLRAASLFVLLSFVLAGASLTLIEARGRGARLRNLYEEHVVEPGRPVELTGVLERAPEIAPDGLVLSLRAESLRLKGEERACAGRVELFAPVSEARAAVLYESLELRRGARVRVMTTLGRAERYRNPGVTPAGEYLERRDLDATGSVKSPLLFERLDDEQVFLPSVWLDEWRGRLVKAFDRTFSADTSGVLKAALLGNRHGLSRETAERFRQGGTFHVLVISGLHITFIGGLAWAVVRRLTRRRALQWAAAVACVWAYALCVGAESSVVRAALMFTVAALAPVLGRRSHALNALGAAALLLLVWRPSNLFDPSFQLTFLSVLGIVACSLPLLSNLKEVGRWRPTRATPYPPACPGWFITLGELLFWSERRHRRESALAAHSYRLFKTPLAARLERWRVQSLLRFVFGAVVVSAVVQAFLLPLLVVYFHRLSLASLVLNVFVGALMAAQAFAALAAVGLSQLSTGAAAPFVWLTETATRLMTGSVEPFAAARVASVRLPEYAGAAGAVYALYFAPLLLMTTALLRWRPTSEAPSAENDRRWKPARVAFVAWFTTAVVIVAHPLSAGRADGRLRVDFLDVGQGDAALLTMPDGTTLLVDGGGRPDFRARGAGREEAESFDRDARGVGEAVVSEYLWWRGLGRVDYLLATHTDADHASGLNDVLKNFDARAAFVARAPSADEEYARLASNARAAGVPIYLLGRGDRLRFGRASVEVLWPPDSNEGVPRTSSNNNSLVLRVTYGRRCFLLTGDIEAQAERALVATSDPLRCDAVKVAHHGSRTSSTQGFIDAASPSAAVVSVGPDSPYGHPHPEVLKRWRDGGALTLTTGERGMITFSTDGEDLKSETFLRQ